MTQESPREIEHRLNQLDPATDTDTPDTPPLEALRSAWTPHDGGQRAVLESDTRFKVVACGRRWGKTELAAYTAAAYALSHDGSLLWWVAPNYNQADVGLRTLRSILPDTIPANITRTEPKAITFPNGAEISFRSADHPDTLRGVGLDYLVVDEAAWVSPEAWHECLRPTLADTEGGMMAISTPKARNWFWKVYQRGESGDHDDYAAFRYPTRDNPHIQQSEIDAAKKSMPDRAFKAEFEAEFLPGGGTVFTELERVLADYDYREAEPEGQCVTGVDFARHQDATVIVTLDGEGTLVDFKRIEHGAWPQIQAAVERVYGRHRGRVYLDATRDNAIIADLEAEGVDVEPVHFSRQRKQELIENLITAIENGELTLPRSVDVLIRELETFEYDTTPAGNVRYGAPEGFHDDCVDALAMANNARSRGRAGAIHIDWGEIDTPRTRAWDRL